MKVASVMKILSLQFNPQYVTVQFMWFTAHFLFWDYSQTLPPEEFSKEGVIQFLASKDTAVYNQLAIWGTVGQTFSSFMSMHWTEKQNTHHLHFRQLHPLSYFSSRRWS